MTTVVVAADWAAIPKLARALVNRVDERLVPTEYVGPYCPWPRISLPHSIMQIDPEVIEKWEADCREAWAAEFGR